ncbi:MAG: amidohydrolase family protein [Saprospiraceae bacterium]|nr:amidohydrolase family protein [Saprospiraceae bacterium]
MNIIDTHQHFWSYEPIKHQWIDDEMANIRSDFGPEELSLIYESLGVEGCIAVHADQTTAETDYLLDLADRFDFIRGVVGWVDLKSGSLAQDLEIWSDNEKLKGFRHVLQVEDPEFILDPTFLEGIKTVSSKGYLYEILIFPNHLPNSVEMVRRLPDTTFILDHIAKPYIKNKDIAQWASHMRLLASHENVSCKISGMVTEADYRQWKKSDFTPYLDVVLEAFGPERLMFGSDWPVCLVAAQYEDVLDIVTSYVGKLSEDEQEQILYTNAINIYKL